MAARGLTEWLLENGGPSIRYRTATELLDDPASVDFDRLVTELFENPLVRLWLERLVPDTDPGGLHHSKNTAYENSMGKLIQLGCRQGMPAFDRKTLPFRSWLEAQIERPPARPFGLFYRTIVAAFLAMAGYHQDQAVKTLLSRRLETLYQFTRQGEYSIYVDHRAYPGFPKAFQGQPLIDPELYAQGDMQLPWIHDINALAHLPEDFDDAAAGKRIDTVIGYILHPSYQRFPQGYGVITRDRRYWKMGWDIKLPGYFGPDLTDREARCLVQRVELMAHFPGAREHPWLRKSLEHLEAFRTERGTYLLPRRYLQERRSGYWVTGAYMGLEENRRLRLALELESTFWMLKIHKVA